MTEPGSSDTVSSKNNLFSRILLAIHEKHIVKVPFIHALKCAIEARGELEIVDVRPPSERSESIGVREYLERWGYLPPDSKRGDVASIGLRIKKVMKNGNRRKLIKKRMERHPHDLLVVGTERHDRHGGILGSSLAAYLAHFFRHTTLFFPEGARPFIDEATGSVSLHRIVMPVENEEFYRHASAHLKELIALFPETSIEVITMHVGTSFPAITTIEMPSVIWRQELRGEPVVESICTVADQVRADLLIMATNGRNTLSQKIIGSNTEQVLRAVSCPVLSVSVL
ncbi:MAG: universal stress protein [Chitinispirillaceae bacterium]|nr:universal stress protein [Chitinispirillaceae bacterium]